MQRLILGSSLQVGGGDPSFLVSHLNVPPPAGILGHHGHGAAGREAEPVSSAGSPEVSESDVHLFLRLWDDLVDWTWLVNWLGGGAGVSHGGGRRLDGSCSTLNLPLEHKQCLICHSNLLISVECT